MDLQKVFQPCKRACSSSRVRDLACARKKGCNQANVDGMFLIEIGLKYVEIIEITLIETGLKVIEDFNKDVTSSFQ